MSSRIKNIAVIAAAALFLFGFSVGNLLKPHTDESVSERRPLLSFPALSTETVMNGKFMSDFDKYTLDQFPMRDAFRSLKAMTSLYLFRQKDNNGIYVENGWIAKTEYPMDGDSIRYATDRFQTIYERYFASLNVPVYVSVIPDKNYFTAKDGKHLSMDYDAFFSQVKTAMPYASYIDIAPLLELSDYYATDTHWRQEKIVDVAEYVAAQMGVNLSSSYTQKEIDKPFYGVYYGQAALPLKPERISYLTNEVLEKCTVYDYETQSELPVYNMDKLDGFDLYEIFLSGSKSLLTIENPSASTDRELILFRDSFGSSFAPLLVDGYAKITLVDIRYISPLMLNRFLTFNEKQEVLFMYSTTVLNNSITFK